VKSLAAATVAIAAIIAAAAGAISVGSVGATAPQIQPIVFGAPVPLDPGPDLPSPGQLLDILNGLQNPNVSFADKSYLVEGGISPVEARLADARLRQAVARGELPLTGSVANIQPAGANAASADITISGPKLTPVTQNLTFVHQGGWKVSRASALTLMEESGASTS
jgi:hypothetical protein